MKRQKSTHYYTTIFNNQHIFDYIYNGSVISVVCVFQVIRAIEIMGPGSFAKAKQVESFIQQRSRDTEGLRPAVLLGHS